VVALGANLLSHKYLILLDLFRTIHCPILPECPLEITRPAVEPITSGALNLRRHVHRPRPIYPVPETTGRTTSRHRFRCNRPPHSATRRARRHRLTWKSTSNATLRSRPPDRRPHLPQPHHWERGNRHGTLLFPNICRHLGFIVWSELSFAPARRLRLVASPVPTAHLTALLLAPPPTLHCLSRWGFFPLQHGSALLLCPSRPVVEAVLTCLPD